MMVVMIRVIRKESFCLAYCKMITFDIAVISMGEQMRKSNFAPALLRLRFLFIIFMV